MRGYPKHIATAKDLDNLLAMPAYRGKALADLKAVKDLKDDTVARTIGIDADGKETTETIQNPLPRWKGLGYASKDAVMTKISVVDAEVEVAGAEVKK